MGGRRSKRAQLAAAASAEKKKKADAAATGESAKKQRRLLHCSITRSTSAVSAFFVGDLIVYEVVTVVQPMPRNNKRTVRAKNGGAATKALRLEAKKQRRLDEQTTEGGGSDAMDADPAR